VRLPSTDEQVDAAIETAGVDLLTLRDVSGVDLPALGWRQIVPVWAVVAAQGQEIARLRQLVQATCGERDVALDRVSALTDAAFGVINAGTTPTLFGAP